MYFQQTFKLKINEDDSNSYVNDDLPVGNFVLDLETQLVRKFTGCQGVYHHQLQKALEKENLEDKINNRKYFQDAILNFSLRRERFLRHFPEF